MRDLMDKPLINKPVMGVAIAGADRRRGQLVLLAQP